MTKLKFIFVSIGVLIIIGALWQFVLPNFRTSNSFLQITTGDLESNVFLDDKLLGKTPYRGEKLEAGEMRMLSYIVYSKVGVIGKFALPTATAIYERDGEIQEAESNRVFFMAEQEKKESEDE